MPADVEAIPPNPKIAAMMANTKNENAQSITMFSPWKI